MCALGKSNHMAYGVRLNHIVTIKGDFGCVNYFKLLFLSQYLRI